MYGYHGRMVRIQVDRPGQARVRESLLAEPVLRRYIGGAGLGAWLLLRESVPGTDALAPDACLILVSGPLVGTPLTTTVKLAVLARSPLTGFLCDAVVSSRFALHCKYTGYDALTICGQVAEPSVLLVNEHGAVVDPAGTLWGLPVSDAEAELRRRYPGYEFLVIGPAGEKRVRYANLSHEGRHAGRGGLGAVLGAKNIKAIGVAGTRLPAVADPKRVASLARDLAIRSLGPHTDKYRLLGTIGNLEVFGRLGLLPTRHFQSEGSSSSRLLHDQLQAQRVERTGCFACTIGCEHRYRTDSDTVRLEYESAFALGPLCDMSDSETVLRAARLCDELGLDTVSTGVTIAWAMECAEAGLLPAPGVRFGHARALLGLIEDIAYRRGLGALLAEGTRLAAHQLGPEALRRAMHVKGLELPGYALHRLPALALGLAVNARGADHNRSGAYDADFAYHSGERTPDEIAAQVVACEDRSALMDSLILCKFLRKTLTDFYADVANMLEAVTGWTVREQTLRTSAAHIANVRRLFNAQHGWSPELDTLPERFFCSAESGSGTQGIATGYLTRERFQAMRRAYYRLRGWSDEGWLPPDIVVEMLAETPGWRTDRRCA